MESDLSFKCPECGKKGDGNVDIIRVLAGMFVDTYYLKCKCCDHHWTERC